jgi:hypothetical protein
MSSDTSRLLSSQSRLALTTARSHDQQSKALADTRRHRRVFMAICLLAVLWGQRCTAQINEASVEASSQAHDIQTVFVILMENHNWTGDRTASLKDNESAPYINDTLLPMASHAERYFNPPKMHPSLPNYLWLEAGTNFGLLNDAGPLVHHFSTHEHLVALLEKKGISWKAYDERATGKTCPFEGWHNPFVFFDDVTENNNPRSPSCIAHIRPFSELQGDLDADRVPRYNFIVPNLCDSMHSVCPSLGNSPIADGDRWLARIVPAILSSSAYRRGGVLFIVWDEGNSHTDGPIPLLVLSPFAKGNGYSNKLYYTHGSLLRTVEEIFGVTPLLRNAAQERDLRDLFSVFP